MGERGMTLIELLVAAGLLVVVTGAGYTFYDHTIKFQALHERQIGMQTRLQTAMDILVREVRHAGYGIMDPLVNSPLKGMDSCAGTLEGVDAISNKGLCEVVSTTDGGTSNPDALKIAQVGDQLVGTLRVATGIDNPVISVDGIGTVNPLDIITIGGFFTAQVVAVVSSPTPVVHTITLNRSPSQNYPVGLPVHSMNNPPAITTYSIGTPATETEPALLRNGVLFASGIEDLQVAYLLSNPIAGAWSASSALTATSTDLATAKNAYLAIRIWLIARAQDPSSDFKGGQRPGLENHPAGGFDNYRRVSLTRVVELKNDGCNPGDNVC